MMFRKVQKLFLLSLFVSIAIIVREFFKIEFLRLVKLADFSQDQLTHDQLPLDRLTADRLLRSSSDRESFFTDWCRLQRSSMDWEVLSGSCHDKMAWTQRESSSKNRTDPDKSFILKKEVKAQGKQI